MNDKLREILHDTWPNLYRPPHDFKPPAEYKMYTVQTWDEQCKCVRYHSVTDAIDYEDAAQVVKDLNPEQQVLAVTKHKETVEFSTDTEETVEKPVEN